MSVPSAGGTLVFSFIGLTTREIEIGERSVVDVQMGQDVKQLSEVVVTGAGIERDKRTLGYRMESVSGSKLQQVSEVDPLRALNGKIAGKTLWVLRVRPVQPPKSPCVVTAPCWVTTSPLIVVDGIPYDNSQNNTSNQLEWWWCLW